MKKTVITLIIIAGAAAGMMFLTSGYRYLSDRTDELANPFLAPDNSAQVEEEGIGASQTELAAGTSFLTQTYTRLIARFEGRRIQFDENCQMIPASVTYKNNVQLMFDNRSDETRVLVIDGRQFVFPAYGWKVITLRNESLPYTVRVNKCDKAVNVGQILIQN